MNGPEVPEDWSGVPSPSPQGQAEATERRPDPAAAPRTALDTRVQGRPAPRYGEYAPEGWVSPVETERQRREHEAAARAAELRRIEAARAAAGTRSRGDASRNHPAPPGGPASGETGSSRLGASAGDLFLTVVLLAFGAITVVQQFAVGQVAANIAGTLEQRYTALADPHSLVPAAVVSAVGCVVILALVVWWSVHRLRARKRTFWVPLFGGIVASLFSTIVYVVVVMQDPHFMAWVLQHGGA